MGQAPTWSLVKTRKVYRSTSGANPGQESSVDATTPATKVPCPRPSSSVGSCVQFDRSLRARQVPAQDACMMHVFDRTNPNLFGEAYDDGWLARVCNCTQYMG